MYGCKKQIRSVILTYDKGVIVKEKLSIVQLQLHAHTQQIVKKIERDFKSTIES